MRQYLSGAIPRMDRVVAMARAMGVNLEWLATGEGGRRPEAGPSARVAVDQDLLGLILEGLLPLYVGTGPDLDSCDVARATADIYSTIESLGLRTLPETRAAIRFAVEQRRRAMRDVGMDEGHVS